MPLPARRPIRVATIADLDAIETLERACFTADAQSRRSLRYLLSRAHAETLVLTDTQGLSGYVLLLYRRGACVARLYSIAVSPAARGAGAGRALLRAAEAAARRRGDVRLRAEVRIGNTASRRLFTGAGYREIERLPAYYPGGEDGLRLDKPLARR